MENTDQDLCTFSDPDFIDHTMYQVNEKIIIQVAALMTTHY